MKLVIKLGIRTQKQKDKAMSFFICLYLIMNAINSLLQDVYKFSGNNLSNAKMVITIILMFFLFRIMCKFQKKEWRLFFLWELIGLFGYIWSLILGVPFSTLKPWANITLGVCIPMALAISFINDKNILYSKLLNVSWIILIILILNMTGNTDKLYNMHFSYGLLLVILLHLNELINNGKKILILFIVFELFMLISYGSRGALVCIVVYLILKILSNIDSKNKKIIYISILLFFCIAFYIFMNYYSQSFYEWILSKGYYSRTLKLLLSGQFVSHDSGRNVLWENVIKLINEKPILGWGIRGAVVEMEHPYPHNLFLDCWLSFGYIIGTGIIIYLLFPIYKVIFMEKGKYKDLTQIFFSISFISLMFSNTFFTNYYYFLFMGLVLSFKNKKKQNYL